MSTFQDKLLQHSEKTAELVTAQQERIAELEKALAKRCQYHHLPLHNGWAHLVKSGIGTQRERVVRCQLDKETRDILAKGKTS